MALILFFQVVPQLRLPEPEARQIVGPYIFREDQGQTTKVILKNGLTVIVREQQAVPLASITTFVKAGYFDEDDRISGISHVIEHIPKYSLLYVVDSLYRALQPGGTMLIRTPNMEGPCANSSFYVTLAHEYGFSGSNLKSLLHICGFDDIRFHTFRCYQPTLKQRAGELARYPIVGWNRLRHRLFGVNQGGHFSGELVVSAKRGSYEPLFDPKLG